jgi:hypothetical protein
MCFGKFYRKFIYKGLTPYAYFLRVLKPYAGKSNVPTAQGLMIYYHQP